MEQLQSEQLAINSHYNAASAGLDFSHGVKQRELRRQVR